MEMNSNYSEEEEREMAAKNKETKKVHLVEENNKESEEEKEEDEKENNQENNLQNDKVENKRETSSEEESEDTAHPSTAWDGGDSPSSAKTKPSVEDRALQAVLAARRRSLELSKTVSFYFKIFSDKIH